VDGNKPGSCPVVVFALAMLNACVMLTDSYIMNYVTIKLQNSKLPSYNLGIGTLHIH
jgi:hypothetical protein